MRTVQDIIDLLEEGEITPDTRLAVSTGGHPMWVYFIDAGIYNVHDPGQWYDTAPQEDILFLKA